MSTPEERIASLLEKDPRFADETEEPEQEEVIEQEATQSEETAETEESGEESESESEPEVEEIQAERLGDLAEHLGVDVADLYGLKIPVTAADGSKKEISIGEWKDAYRESDLLKAERQKQEQEIRQVQENLAEKAQAVDIAYSQADAMIKAAEKQIIGEIGALEQLQHTDPTQYVMKKQQLTDKQTELSQLRNQAVQNYQAQQQQLQQEQEQQRQQFLAQQNSLLTQYIPEWKDESVMNKERAELASYLVKSGIPEQEVNQIASAKMVELGRKAMLWDRQTQSNPEAKKKVITIGKKVLKSGKAQTKQSKAQRSKQEDYKVFRKRGDTKAAAEYIEKHLLGDF